MEMSRQLYGDRSTLSLLLTLAIPLDPQHGPPCSRQECLPRHTSTIATTSGMPSDLDSAASLFLSYSCRSLPSPTPLLPYQTICTSDARDSTLRYYRWLEREMEAVRCYSLFGPCIFFRLLHWWILPLFSHSSHTEMQTQQCPQAWS